MGLRMHLASFANVNARFSHLPLRTDGRAISLYLCLPKSGQRTLRHDAGRDYLCLLVAQASCITSNDNITVKRIRK
jgi:hypothetical protein